MFGRMHAPVHRRTCIQHIRTHTRSHAPSIPQLFLSNFLCVKKKNKNPGPERLFLVALRKVLSVGEFLLPHFLKLNCLVRKDLGLRQFNYLFRLLGTNWQSAFLCHRFR